MAVSLTLTVRNHDNEEDYYTWMGKRESLNKEMSV